MGRISIFIYGILAYFIAFIAQVWFIIYLTNWDIVGKNIYHSQESPTLNAILINILLVLLFGLQHSLMARGWFKKSLLKYIPEAMERSTYVLLSGVALILIPLCWQPIDGTIWSVNSESLRVLLWIGFISGWLFSLFSTFIINHFELFGLQQIYFHLLNKKKRDEGFKEKLFYKFIRHPIQFGVLLGIWITPTMNYGHLMLSTLFTLYIFIGIYFEERDLIKEFGEIYLEYKNRVGLMFPKHIFRKRD